jgi:hypothetical protein
VHWQKHSYRDICSTPETTKTIALPSARNTQHTPHGNDVVGKELFAFFFGAPGKHFAECLIDSRQKKKGV